MVIDDEVSIVHYLHNLRELYGNDLITFTSSEHSLAAFQQAPDTVDAVITDQTMPDMTGIRLSRELLSIRADTPIIITTGYSDQIDEKIARRSGIAAYIEKPINNDVLLDRIKELLTRTANTTAHR